jgi:ATP-binding cassette, subfamily B (MDR/TAP), member 1
VVVLVAIISSRVQTNIDAQASKLSEAAKLTANALSGIETVKCCNGEDEELRNYACIINEAAHYFRRQTFWSALQSALLRLTTLSMFVQGFWYGNVLLSKGDITPSEILTAFWGALLAIQFLIQIAPFLVLLEKGKSAGQKLRAAVYQLEASDGELHVKHLPKPNRCVGDILFEQVRQ